jgi:glycosyltransferase involved in cell wall biosynthesis
MKVLHVIPGLARRYGGPSRAIVGMCRSLRERGVETLVAATDADGRARLEVELRRLTTYDGVPAIFFPRQVSEGFKYSRPLTAWLRERVTDFDVVHVHAVFSHSSLAASRAARDAGIPYVVRPLGSLAPWSLRQKRIRKALLWRLGVEQMLKSASRIHYTTAEEEKLAEPLCVAAGVVIPMGVEEFFFLAPSAVRLASLFPGLGEQPYLLTLSRLHPKKGLEVLMESFLTVTADAPLNNWRLVIAGAGDRRYMGKLRAIAAESRGGDRVLFPGWLDGNERVAAVQGASLFALTSRQENFGISVAEAMASGVPVVVSDCVNLGEEIERKGAGWVVPLDRQAISQALTAALGDETERRRRGELARQLAEGRFRWARVADQLLCLYQSLVKAKDKD